MQKTKIALFVSALMLPPVMAWAEETVSQDTADILSDDIAVLDEVVVSETSFSQQIGTQKITEEQMERRPTNNGNITELLKTNPNVRFSSTSEGSMSGGEIKPDDVSFHGEKYYNNNFIINGMSNNDNLNPGASSGRIADSQPPGTNAHDLPSGDTQSFWIDTSSLKSVEVFDSNISAKYGSFSGGVINAELKDPDLDKRSGKVYYRTTNDSWAKFHIDPDRENSFLSATALNLQPDYLKQSYGFVLSQPISDKAALRLSYNRTTSDIQFYHSTLQTYDAQRNLSDAGQYGNVQRRINETLTLNGVYFPDNGDLWRTTIIYSPHSERYYKPNVVHGGFTNTGGGVQASVGWEKQFENVKMKSFFGYKKSGNTIEQEMDDYYNYRPSDYLNWISGSNLARMGGYGKFRTEKQTYTLKQDYEVNEFEWKDIQHKIIFGWDANLANAKYKRDTESTNYSVFVKDSNVICNGDVACIVGDQYASTKQVYETRNVSVSDNQFGAYIEDRMKWKKLEFTAGLRVDHNGFYGTTNFAHRLSTSYDLFGDSSTRLFGGYNRYYNGSMLAYKLRQDIGRAYRQSRTLNTDGTLGEWQDARIVYNSNQDVSKMKNPYADEINAGISQQIGDMLSTFKWVHRESRNQLLRTSATRSDGSAYSTLSNNGWTKNDTLTLTLTPKSGYKSDWFNLGYNFGFSYNKTKTNYKYYESTDEDVEYYIVNKKLIYAPNGLVPADFNSPWQAHLDLNFEFPKLRLTWDHRFSYAKGQNYFYQPNGNTVFSCDGANTSNTVYREACGDFVGDAKIYEEGYKASHLLVDWRFSYKQPTFKDQYLQIDLDINNVLNRRVAAKSADGNTVYKMGRNFWLGASYNW